MKQVVDFKEIKKGASQEELDEISEFATRIVRNHFDPIIGKAQNDYMLEKFQSPESIAGQIDSGYRYYWADCAEGHAGFVAFYPRDGKMYFSKFYVAEDFRGHHIAGRMLDFVRSETVKAGLDRIFLNVNRNNIDVIAIYEHFGFVKTAEEKNDIGNGFVMDDYVMELELKS